MPRRTDDDEETPRRRRRGAKAAAIEVERERGLMTRMFLHSPKDMLAGLLAAAAICAILANALFLQAGRHPSPMFGSVVTLPAPHTAAVNPLPRPRPVELVTDPPTIGAVEARGADPKNANFKNADPKDPDPMGDLRQVDRCAHGGACQCGTSAGAGSGHRAKRRARRVAGVQRALPQYGYGQLKPTGAVGADTQAAITKFERDRKLPVTGQMSDRLVKELTA